MRKSIGEPVVNLRKLEKGVAAAEKAKLVFYQVIEKDGKRMMKPIPGIETEVPLGMVKAISENTIRPDFYERLAIDLRQRGVKEGTLVQVRAQFGKEIVAANPSLKGAVVLCEVKV